MPGRKATECRGSPAAKAKAKAAGKAKPKAAAKRFAESFSGNRDYCGKTGHEAANCRQKRADAVAGAAPRAGAGGPSKNRSRAEISHLEQQPAVLSPRAQGVSGSTPGAAGPPK